MKILELQLKKTFRHSISFLITHSWQCGQEIAKIFQLKILPLRIKPEISCVILWCILDRANLAFLEKACSQWVVATAMVPMWTPPFVSIKPIHDGKILIFLCCCHRLELVHIEWWQWQWKTSIFSIMNGLNTIKWWCSHCSGNGKGVIMGLMQTNGTWGPISLSLPPLSVNKPSVWTSSKTETFQILIFSIDFS